MRQKKTRRRKSWPNKLRERKRRNTEKATHHHQSSFRKSDVAAFSLHVLFQTADSWVYESSWVVEVESQLLVVIVVISMTCGVMDSTLWQPIFVRQISMTSTQCLYKLKHFGFCRRALNWQHAGKFLLEFVIFQNYLLQNLLYFYNEMNYYHFGQFLGSCGLCSLPRPLFFQPCRLPHEKFIRLN
jgi:hypothetical protein